VVISAHLVSGPSDLDATPETAAERYARRDVRVDEPDDLPQPNSASRSRFLTRGWGHGR
jgi:hypothetical protein